MPYAVAKTKYLSALAGIGRTYEGARKGMVAAYWDIGRQIVELEQDGEVRAQYGSDLLRKISADLSGKYGTGFSRSNVNNMRRFYLTNERIQTSGQLTWSDHVELLRVGDPKRRKALEKRAAKEGLSNRKIRWLVSEEVRTKDFVPEAEVKPPAPLKRPKGLELSTYKKAGDYIDCGFYVLYPVSKEDVAGVKLCAAPAYTYAASVERVVDGDTLWAFIEVGFGIVVREKLRFRGINTPELGTPEGEKAKAFVARLLPAKSRIVIRSAKDDKYGRFVADIFYKNGASAPEDIIAGGTYLNQELLDLELAERME